MDLNWYIEIEEKINELIEKLSPSEVKKLQLKYLKVVSQRVDNESINCDRCEHLKKDIEEAINIIEKASGITSIQRKAYNMKIRQIISHLKNGHNLLSNTYYQNQYSLYGFIGGIAFGICFFDKYIILISVLILSPYIGKIIGLFKDKKNIDNLI